MKKITLIFAFMLAVAGAAAQSMYVHKTDGNVYEFKVSDVDSINFAASTTDDFHYTVTYMPNGGEGEVVIDTVRYGCSYAIRSNAGTRFISWNTSADGTGAAYAPTENIVVMKDIVLYAQWLEQIFTPTSFSVSSTKKVYFSPGNLQYHPMNDQWQFAPSQLDYIGDANSNISGTYNGWLDLFGWSTSTTNFGVSTSTDWENDYLGSFVDWGSNQIGDDVPNTWRTLTYDEWYYLRYNRTNANDLCGVAQVYGVNGLILLPDSWTCPDGITFKSGFHDSSGVDYYAAYQTFTAEQWSQLEAAGAVFLPAAGNRYGSDVVYSVQNNGYYWSATEYDSNFAYYLYFYSDEASMGSGNRYYGRSVRLVQDL